MPDLRLPLVETVEPRLAGTNKDGLSKNVFIDKNTRNEFFSAKRPGIDLFVTGAGNPISSDEYAWGIYSYQVNPRQIVNGNVVVGDPVNILFSGFQTSQGNPSGGISTSVLSFPNVPTPSAGSLPTPTEGPGFVPAPIYTDPLTGATISGNYPPPGNTDPGTWTLDRGFGNFVAFDASCGNGTSGLLTASRLRTETNVIGVSFSPTYSACGGIVAWKWVITKASGPPIEYIAASATYGYKEWTSNFYSEWDT